MRKAVVSEDRAGSINPVETNKLLSLLMSSQFVGSKGFEERNELQLQIRRLEVQKGGTRPRQKSQQHPVAKTGEEEKKPAGDAKEEAKKKATTVSLANKQKPILPARTSGSAHPRPGKRPWNSKVSSQPTIANKSSLYRTTQAGRHKDLNSTCTAISRRIRKNNTPPEGIVGTAAGLGPVDEENVNENPSSHNRTQSIGEKKIVRVIKHRKKPSLPPPKEEPLPQEKVKQKSIPVFVAQDYDYCVSFFVCP